MSEDIKKPGKSMDAELLKKLEKLEVDIQEIDRARRQQAVIARVGLLLILLAFALFAMNLYKFYKTITSEENVSSLAASVSKDMQEMIENDANLKAFRNDITEKLIPAISKQVMERMGKEMPVFKQKGEKILENIKVQLEDTVKTKITEELDISLKEIEQELVKQYPNLSVDKIDAIFKKTEGIFLENVTDMLQKKVELVYEDLDEMEKTLNKFGKIADERKLNEKEKDMVKLDFIENLLELAIYHVNPDKGELSAETLVKSEKMTEVKKKPEIKPPAPPPPTTLPAKINNKKGAK